MQWLIDKALSDTALTSQEALAILQASPDKMPLLMYAASEVRRRRFGDTVRLCSILNGRCGSCSEDCAFCAQSSHHKADVSSFPMVSASGIHAAAKSASSNPINHFGVVTSGGSLDDTDVDVVCSAVTGVKAAGVIPCASLGMLSDSQFRSLRRAGLVRYHHNIETARSFFPQICSTHTFDDRIATLRKARAAGLELCSGGIFGLGESLEQRVEMAVTLRDENVQSIPLNFLMPIPGTPLENAEPVKPLEVLRVVVMFRMVCRDAEIKICAGRDSRLRDLQSMFFYAGATGIMVGNYLTTAGRPIEQDLRLLNDLEVNFEWE